MIVCPNCNHQNPEGAEACEGLATVPYLPQPTAHSVVQPYKLMPHSVVNVAIIFSQTLPSHKARKKPDPANCHRRRSPLQ